MRAAEADDGADVDRVERGDEHAARGLELAVERPRAVRVPGGQPSSV